MIPRYKVQEIHDIWKTENKLSTWLKVEMAHLRSLLLNQEEETITQEEFDTIESNISINVDRWKDIETETKHDLQAFVQMLEESIPDNSGRWIHFGLTSSDILDTSLTLMCQESLSVIKNDVNKLLQSINKLLERKDSKKKLLSRTHGKSAEVQTYWDIFCRWKMLVARAQNQIIHATYSVNLGKLSGVSGNNTLNSITNESKALNTLGLSMSVCSQIIPRDIYLDYFYAIQKVMLAVEKISYDIRMYSIDGVNEMAEPFTKGQKGSSAMPHKKNPILTENLCGLSRLYKTYMITAIDNCNTLFERDISHSSSERIIFKDAAHLACFSLRRLKSVTSGLQILSDNAQANVLKFQTKTCSQSKMNELIKSGMSRKQAHDVLQEKTSG